MILLTLLACSNSTVEDTAAFETNYAVADCRDILFSSDYVVASVGDVEILDWAVTVTHSNSNAWLTYPDEAVWLSESNEFILSSAHFCPLEETMRVAWLARLDYELDSGEQ